MFSFSALGLGWIIVTPDELPWLMAIALGIGLGAGLALGLTLLVDHAHTSRLRPADGDVVPHLVQRGVPGPVILGVLRDATGAYVIAFAVLLVVMVAALALVPCFTPERREGRV